MKKNKLTKGFEKLRKVIKEMIARNQRETKRQWVLQPVYPNKMKFLK
jgi:hypothetical protein